MTPQKQRNEHLAQTIIKNLKRRHIEGFYCATAEEAVKKVSELIADGSSVTWGGTMTVRDLGIPQYLKDRGTLEVLDATWQKRLKRNNPFISRLFRPMFTCRVPTLSRKTVLS